MFSAFLEFRLWYEKLCEKRPGGPLCTLLVRKNLQLNFRIGRAQPIPLDPKLMFSAFLEFLFWYEKLCENPPGGPLWTLLVRKN